MNVALIKDGVSASVNTAIEILPGQTVGLPTTAAEVESDDASDANQYRLDPEASKTYTLILSPDIETVINAIALLTDPGALNSLNQTTAPGVTGFSCLAQRKLTAV